mgnify:CR=1 FL=1
MSNSKDCDSRDNLKLEDFDAAVKFLTHNVFPGYDGLKDKAECELSVQFLDFGDDNAKNTAFSTFLHTYIANPPRSHMGSGALLAEIGKKFNRVPPFLKNIEGIDYDPLQEVHKIAMYLTFLAFMRPQHCGSNVLYLFLSRITALPNYNYR